MFGIPQWAIGVAFIIIAMSFARALMGRSALTDRVRGRKASRRDLALSLSDLQEKFGGAEEIQRRMDELEDVQRRLAEVEERLDFAERLLTKQRDAERLKVKKD